VRITKRQLLQIIKEESTKLVNEQAVALLKQSTLEALNDALERAYYEAIDGAMAAWPTPSEEEATEIAFAAIMEEVDGFADSMGHHTRTGRRM